MVNRISRREYLRRKRRSTRIKVAAFIAGMILVMGFVGHEDFKSECCTSYECEIIGDTIITPKGNTYEVPKRWHVEDGIYIVYFADNIRPYDYEKEN